ncbi:MAG: hypothetical protein H6835_07010 [Planctomycetes bacterium]|nr:hypothetical protein [Planctomycetota bacterium]
MARSFHQSLLAAVVAVVVGGSALAQETPLQEAVILLRVNQPKEAIEKLQEILHSDPSNEEALRLYQSVSQDEWYLLMTQEGEIQKIARSILEKAQVTRKERNRDKDAIAALVDTVVSVDASYEDRQGAINKLVVEHGEFAVPALVERLGVDDANTQIQSIAALNQLGAVAVLPLIEALGSSNDLVVRNVAAALKLIADRRAAPMMASLANDPRTDVQSIAQKFLEKVKVSGDALNLMLAQADGYLKGVIPPGGYSEVVWSLVDDKLVATDVPSQLYPTELAKAVAAHAVAMAPTSLAARSSLAQANLAEAELIGSDEALAELAPVADDLKIAALATGVDALRGALDAGVAKGLAPVAVGAIHALSEAELVDSIGDSALVAALNSTDKRIQYAAANALVRASRGNDVPQLGQVVDVLAQAVTEEKVNTVKVIAPPSNDVSAAVASLSGVRSFTGTAETSAVMGIRDLLWTPTDVVVINEILPDRMPEDVIGNIKKDPRMAHTRIVVVTKDEDAARERFGDEVTFTMAPLTGESLIAAVSTALEGAENAAGARAETYASAASADLLSLARRKADIAGAVTNLALQLNRGDTVAVPAARAVGLAGGENELPALLAALESGSDELKVASAEAIGNVLGRMPVCPDAAVAGLSAAMDASSDVVLRKAIAIAFGKAKLDAEKKAELLRKLAKVAGTGGEG